MTNILAYDDPQVKTNYLKREVKLGHLQVVLTSNGLAPQFLGPLGSPICSQTLSTTIDPSTPREIPSALSHTAAVDISVKLNWVKNLRKEVTIEILHKLRDMAAACVGFFGFLQEEEFIIPSTQSYDPEIHLNLGTCP